MVENNNEKEEYGNRVRDFYKGKSIFITGASGFLGTVLLEILLRCLPDVSKIYLLLRSKKDTSPEERKRLIFKKKIFRILLKENPDVVNKVKVVPGDIQESNLGMCDEDLKNVIQEVTIIFHVAAVISFFKPLRYSVINNCLGTWNVIELARKLQKLDVLVYTSSAYSNCNRTVIEEHVYRLPFKAKRYMDALSNDNCDELERLKNMIKPDFPNNYTFSKCLAENILNDFAKDLPVAIVRPSIIGSCWFEPFRGYVERGSGMVTLSMAVGKGFGRVLFVDPEQRFDLVPVDISARCHIVSAWAVATKKLQSPLVVNNSGGPFRVTYDDFISEMLLLSEMQVLPKGFSKPSCACITNPILFQIFNIYEHYLPAYCIDVYLKMRGNKFSLVKMYKFLDRVWLKMKYFLGRTFDFKMETYNQLSKLMDPRDTEIFSLDLHEVSLHKIIQSIPEATDFFDWSQDTLAPEKRKEVLIRRARIISCLKITIIVLLVYLLHRIISLIL